MPGGQEPAQYPPPGNVCEWQGRRLRFLPYCCLNDKLSERLLQVYPAIEPLKLVVVQLDDQGNETSNAILIEMKCELAYMNSIACCSFPSGILVMAGSKDFPSCWITELDWEGRLATPTLLSLKVDHKLFHWALDPHLKQLDNDSKSGDTGAIEAELSFKDQAPQWQCKLVPRLINSSRHFMEVFPITSSRRDSP